MYEKPITEAEAHEAGFELEDYEDDDPVEVWSEIIESVNLFIDLGSQWRVGMSGPTGLDYASVFATIDRLHRGATDARRDELFYDVKKMESAALKEMAKK